MVIRFGDYFECIKVHPIYKGDFIVGKFYEVKRDNLNRLIIKNECGESYGATDYLLGKSSLIRFKYISKEVYNSPLYQSIYG